MKIFSINKSTLWILSLLLSYLTITTYSQAAEVKGKVLIVASSATHLKLKEGKKVATGNSLGELAIPAQRLIDAGYQVIIATPDGKKPTIDKNSKKLALFNNDKKEYKKALKFANSNPAMKKPKRLINVLGKLDEYLGIYVPGDHAPMVDLVKDANLGTILKHFHKESKPTALLCHAPIVLLSTLPNAANYIKALEQEKEDEARKLARDWPYYNYELTVFSNEEEKQTQISKFKGELKFFAANALENAGAEIKNGDSSKSFVIEDKELITGQNYASIEELTGDFIKALDKNAKDKKDKDND